jgi:flagellin FlaB
MTPRFYSKRKKSHALTGLETAIILIAFIIVASTFAFTILNMGFQTAQKTGQVVQNGVNQASSSIQLDGAVIATGDTVHHNVTAIQFVITPSAGVTPIDLNTTKFTVSYQSADKYVADAYTNTTAGVVISQLSGNGNTLLESGEAFQVTVYLNGTTIHDSIGTYSQFTIELKPADGTVLTIQRVLPSAIATTMNLG